MHDAEPLCAILNEHVERLFLQLRGLVCKNVKLFWRERIWVDTRALKHKHGDVPPSLRLLGRDVDNEQSGTRALGSRLSSLTILL
jgi:hypothetical protein